MAVPKFGTRIGKKSNYQRIGGASGWIGIIVAVVLLLLLYVSVYPPTSNGGYDYHILRSITLDITDSPPPNIEDIATTKSHQETQPRTTIHEVNQCWRRDLKIKLDERVSKLKAPKFDSAKYWETRYNTGDNSGAGSYGASATHKAAIINGIVHNRSIKSVMEFGVGDGNNQALYTDIPTYIGLDVSQTTIDNVQKKYSNDPTRTYLHYDTFMPLRGRADMTLSLDVIYHLIEPNVYLTYLDNLFDAAKSDVLIFASDKDMPDGWGYHFLPRKFTPYVEAMLPCWQLKKVYDMCDGCSHQMHHFVRTPNCFEKHVPCVAADA